MKRMRHRKAIMGPLFQVMGQRPFRGERGNNGGG